MVLTYAGCLPEGALLRVAKPVAPIWLDAQAGLGLSDAGRVVEWQAHGGNAAARPVAANTRGTLCQDQALHFVAGENGGLTLPHAAPDLTTLTFAAILSPNLPEARTLLSLQVAGSEDYIFLSLQSMTLRLVQRGAEGEVTLTLPPDTRVPLLVIGALNRGAARLSVNLGPVVSGALPLPTGPADLFIGCRNGRGGMKNKLGSFDLTDVMLWPGLDLLQAPLPEAVTTLWNKRCRLGL